MIAPEQPAKDAATLYDTLQGLNAYPRRLRDGAYVARCMHPAHHDNSPSMAFCDSTTQPGKVLLHCFACDNTGTTSWVRQTLANIEALTVLPDPDRKHMPSGGGQSAAEGTLTAIYQYTRSGEQSARKLRYEDQDTGRKTFLWERPYGGQWATGLGHLRQADLDPYGWDQVSAAPDRVIVAEGEKDRDRLMAEGLRNVISTVDGKPPEPVKYPLSHRPLTVIVDRDVVGSRHAHEWYTQYPHAQFFVTCIDTPGADISDHLDHGYKLPQMVDITDLVHAKNVPVPKIHANNLQFFGNETPGPNPEPKVEGERWDNQKYWAAHPLMQWCRAAGSASMSSPDALLLNTLARLRAELPPNIQMRTDNGGARGSLNLGVMIVGHSGAGKSTSHAVIEDNPPLLLEQAGGWCAQLATPASGEAITSYFAVSRMVPTHHGSMKKIRRLEYHNLHALLYFDEIAALQAASHRAQSTLSADIRSMISGQPFGRSTVGEGRGIVIPRHTVSVAVVVCALPKSTGFILAETDSGTPQRYVWATAHDKDCLKEGETAPWPGPPPISPSLLCPSDDDCLDLSATPVTPRRGSPLTFTLPTLVGEESSANRRRGLMGDQDLEESHSHLTRMKVACLIAATEGTLTVSMEHWELSGQVMIRSGEARQMCVDAVREDSIDAAKKAGLVAAGKRIAEDEALRDEREVRIGKAMALTRKHLQGSHMDSDCGQSCLSRAMRHYRDVLTEVAELGEQEGLFRAVDVVGVEGARPKRVFKVKAPTLTS